MKNRKFILIISFLFFVVGCTEISPTDQLPEESVDTLKETKEMISEPVIKIPPEVEPKTEEVLPSPTPTEKAMGVNQMNNGANLGFSAYYKDKIYYSDFTGIYRMNRDLTEKEQISDKYVKLRIVDDIIYYVDNEKLISSTADFWDTLSLHMMTIEGEYIKEVYADEINSYQIYKDRVIFTRDMFDDGLFALNIATGEIETIIDVGVYPLISRLIIINNYVYFAVSRGLNQTTGRANLDTYEVELYDNGSSDTESSSITALGDDLYISGIGTFKLDFESKAMQEEINSDYFIYSFNAYNGYLYFIAIDTRLPSASRVYQLYKKKAGEDEIVRISDKEYATINVFGDDFIIARPELMDDKLILIEKDADGKYVEIPIN